MRALLPAVFLAAALTVGCGNNSATSPTSTSTSTSTSTTSTTSASTVTYTGTLDVGASRFYSFTNVAAGSVTAFLASVTAADDSRVPLAVPLELGIGIPAGTSCPATTTQVVTPGLTAQMSTSLAAGVFCLRVADAGQMKSPVMFAVRFTHP